MKRSASSGEARHCEIEAAPEEMNRTDFPQEAAPELLEQLIDLNEHPPETMRGLGIIGVVLPILRERDGARYFVRQLMDPDCNTELPQERHHSLIELRNGLRLEGKRALFAA